MFHDGLIRGFTCGSVPVSVDGDLFVSNIWNFYKRRRVSIVALVCIALGVSPDSLRQQLSQLLPLR